MKKSKGMCVGCRQDFYNGKNDLGIAECWRYKDAHVVKRWRIGHWTPMDTRANFSRVTVLNCFHRPGQVAFLERLPEHLGGDVA